MSIVGNCAVCHKPFTTNHPVSEFNTFDRRPINNDCYYDEFRKEIGEHPIVSPELIQRIQRRKGQQ